MLPRPVSRHPYPEPTTATSCRFDRGAIEKGGLAGHTRKSLQGAPQCRRNDHFAAFAGVGARQPLVVSSPRWWRTDTCAV